MAEKEIKIVRHEHYKRPLPLNSGRVAKLKFFRERIKEFAVPTPSVTEEAVIVTLKRGVDFFTTDHLHPDVVRFRDLIDHKKAAGKEVTISDGILAYLLVWGQGRKSTIAGFLWAMGDDYPDFRYTHKEFKVKETYRTLLGKLKERVVVRRPKEKLPDVEALIPIVGQELSRLRDEGVISG